MRKLFSFECKACNEEVERLVHDDERPACAKCNEPMQKMLTAPAFTFKAEPSTRGTSGGHRMRIPGHK